MGILEKYLLIGAIKWLFRWLSSNEKNQKNKGIRIKKSERYEYEFEMDEIVDTVYDILENPDGNPDS